MRVSSSSGRAASKIAPQIRSAFTQILVAAHQLVDGRHTSIVSTLTLRVMRHAASADAFARYGNQLRPATEVRRSAKASAERPIRPGAGAWQRRRAAPA